jgi:hypothetical protein
MFEIEHNLLRSRFTKTKLFLDKINSKRKDLKLDDK